MASLSQHASAPTAASGLQSTQTPASSATFLNLGVLNPPATTASGLQSTPQFGLSGTLPTHASASTSSSLNYATSATGISGAASSRASSTSGGPIDRDADWSQLKAFHEYLNSSSAAKANSSAGLSAPPTTSTSPSHASASTVTSASAPSLQSTPPFGNVGFGVGPYSAPQTVASPGTSFSAFSGTETQSFSASAPSLQSTSPFGNVGFGVGPFSGTQTQSFFSPTTPRVNGAAAFPSFGAPDPQGRLGSESGFNPAMTGSDALPRYPSLLRLPGT